jgi:hypothetical protein
MPFFNKARFIPIKDTPKRIYASNSKEKTERPEFLDFLPVKI